VTPEEFMQADFLQNELCLAAMERGDETCGECAACIIARSAVCPPPGRLNQYPNLQEGLRDG
jgi:hypothetical protein